MRRNIFGDIYCTASEELVDAFNELGYDPAKCFADVFPDEDEAGWHLAEIKDNVDGEIVAYVEKVRGRTDMKNVLVAAGMSPSSINFV